MEENRKFREFVMLVENMRALQKSYDNRHLDFFKKEKKGVEALVDKWITEYRAVNAPKQGELL